MKFIILLSFLAVSSAQQYYDQVYDIMYHPPQVQMVRNRPMMQRPQGRELSGFPQNYPQSIPVGYSDPRQQQQQQPHQQPGCKNDYPNGQSPYAQHQPQQPAGSYVPPQSRNQYQPQPYAPQQPQHHQQQQQYNPQQQQLGYSANHQIGQAVQPPQNLYEILLPQKNELGEDYQSKSRASPYGMQKNQQQHPYPLTAPSIRFKIGLVADLGKDSKSKDGTFMSYLREGHLIIRKADKEKENETEKEKDDSKDAKEEKEEKPKLSHNVTVEFKEDVEPQTLITGLNDAGEGLELSTLNVFQGKLYACDDQTGIIYELVTEDTNVTLVPWVILPSRSEKRTTFKCEWATVKDNHLWVGSIGVGVWKDQDAKVNDKQMIKKISPEGHVETLDWSENYNKIAKELGVDLKTGFVNHEAAAWSDILQKWIFLPRRVSKEKFDKNTIDKTGTNIAIFADDQFQDIEMKNLGELVEAHGWTSAKFIPGSQDQLILALKVGMQEETGMVGSSLAVYDVEGNVVMEPIVVADNVYAAVEFL